MKIEIKVWVIVLVLIGLLTGIYFLGGIKYRRDIDRLSTALIQAQNQLSDTVESYEITLGDKVFTIADQKRIILNQEAAIKHHILDKEKLKKLNIAHVQENVKLRAQLTILKDSLELIKPEIIYVVDADSVSVPHLRLPHELNYEDSWMDVGVMIEDNLSWGFSIDSPIEADVTIADVKTGWLKKEPRVLISTDNPYFDVINVQSVSIKKEPLFFETTWFRITTHALSFLGGFYLGGR